MKRLFKKIENGSFYDEETYNIESEMRKIILPIFEKNKDIHPLDIQNLLHSIAVQLGTEYSLKSKLEKGVSEIEKQKNINKGQLHFYCNDCYRDFLYAKPISKKDFLTTFRIKTEDCFNSCGYCNSKNMNIYINEEELVKFGKEI